MLTNLVLESALEAKEKSVIGEVWRQRIYQKNFITFDENAFYLDWKMNHCRPEFLKQKIRDKEMFIFYDGFTAIDPDGRRHAVCMYWTGLKWSYQTRDLSLLWTDTCVSIGIAKPCVSN